MSSFRNRWTGALPSLGDIAFLMPVMFLFGGLQGVHSLLSDGDTGWHIRAGDWMLAHEAIARQDLFSFTRPGRPWFAWEWLSEVIMAWLARHGGLAAVALAAALILALTFALLYRLLWARSGNALIAIAVTAVAVAGSSIHWLARPHLATLLLTVVFLRILESGRRLWLLPVWMALWTNLHAGFVFGLLLVAVWAVCERRRTYWIALAAALAATLANPYGWHLHGHILRYFTADSWQFNHINEFLSPSFHHPRALFVELMLGLGMAAIPWHLGRGRFHYALLVAGTSHMALVSARNIPIFLIVAALPVTLAVAEWLCHASRAGLPERWRRRVAQFERLAADVGRIERLPRIPVASALASLGLAAALYASSPSPKFRAEFDPQTFPVRAVDALGRGWSRPGEPPRIFTIDQWGDYLIYRLYPGIRVFVDGRSDFYGSELEQTCQNVLNIRYDWQGELGRYRVDTVLLPADSSLAGALKEAARWHVVYDDASAIVFRSDVEGGQDSGGKVAHFGPPENQQITLRSELK